MTRARMSCERGVVMLEMLLCLTPVMLMFMATIQASLLSVAHLVVRHAAQRGARTASVVLEEDPKYFGDSPRGRLEQRRSGASSENSAQAQASADLMASLRSLVSREPSRLNAIRAAVYLPLSVVGSAGLLRNFVATAVTFPQAQQSDTEYRGDYGPTDDITVRVTYLFECEIPLAAALMCDKLYELYTGVPVDDVAGGVGALWQGDVRGAADHARRARDRRQRLTQQQQAMAELRHVEQPQLQALLALGGRRYTPIRADVTLPIQGARYYARQP